MTADRHPSPEAFDSGVEDLGLVDWSHGVTSLGYLIIGLCLLNLALRLWFTSPVNRVFLFGPYLTEHGLRSVLKAWPLVFLFGVFIVACGIDHGLDLLVDGHKNPPRSLQIAAVFEAVVTSIAAIIVLHYSVRNDFWRV